MGLAEKFTAAAGNTNRAKCAVASVKSKMTTSDEEAAFDAAITNTSISGQVVSTVMRDEGYELSAFSVRRHRRGECSC